MGDKAKVIVGMSGGVDSSVAAALLVEQGFSVTGVMLRLWSEPGREGSNRCCTPDAMAQARKVASDLGIPLYVLDVKEQFHDEVVEAFTSGYARGITPNPCLVCNMNIRWGFLLQRALIMGADYFATGHYARLRKQEDGQIKLLEGVDKNKDQSYVLSILNQDQLSHTMLPLGGLNKPQVRQLARQYNLAVADRAESQDLCFLAGADYRSFLQNHVPEITRPGEIINRSGSVIGHHEGLAFYTIGQRKGLGIAYSEPLYVLEKRQNSNQIVVGIRGELGAQKLVAGHVNWIEKGFDKESFRAQVKIRYKAPKEWGTVTPIDVDHFGVEFDKPQRDITPGQNAVLYKDETCIGCGLIDQAL